MKIREHQRSVQGRSISLLTSDIHCAWILFLSLNYMATIKFGTAIHASRMPSIDFAAAPYNSQAESPSTLPPSSAPDSLVPLLPSSPMYPLLPSGSTSTSTMGLCNLNFSAASQILHRTAGDCTAPLAAYVGNVICCPQFESMVRVFQGELSTSSHLLVLNSTDAIHCFSDMMDFLINNGANNTIPKLCNVQPVNLTGGLCPVNNVEEFEQIVNTSKLLAACSSVDPLKECCKPSCQPVITDSAVRLASRDSSSLEANSSLATANLQQVMDDCQGVVFSWLGSQLDAEVANSAFRNLFNCRVNRVCPLHFDDPSAVALACSGTSPANSSCCRSLYTYISGIQQQMLITNVQALDCVTLFGSMLQKRSVTANVYELCQVDLKDFSLQVFGEQGCLLRALPTDVYYDKSSGISFTCDLNDNIAAPWPSSSSLSSFPLCAPSESLPALPNLKSSGGTGLPVLGLATYLLTAFCMFILPCV
eukprot:c28216_g1_i2 orf=781-2211(+)